MTTPRLSRPVLAVVLVLAGATAHAQSVVPASKFQIAPFAGYQFGGSVYSPDFERSLSFKSGLAYGGTIDISTGESWRVELLYSRQSTVLEDAEGLAPDLDVTVERYMLGLQEETGEGTVRYFGTLLAGITRLVPGFGNAGSDTRFTAGVGLGVKSFFSRHVGLRLEVRGFYTVVEKGGSVFCTAGTCLIEYSGSGIWQGDASGGLIFSF